MKHQMLVASYRPDFIWLRYLLISLKRFSSGFLPPVVVVPSTDLEEARALADETFPEAQVKVKDGRGFLRAQIVMMQGDIFCPEADVVHLFGSDCFVFAPLTPEAFLRNGKPEILTGSYEKLNHAGLNNWRTGVVDILGIRPRLEYMRRIPIPYPREMYAPFRRAVEVANLGSNFEKVIYASAPRRNCSESNLMGAWLDLAMSSGQLPRVAEFFDTDTRDFSELPPNPVMQFWSHGGLTRLCDRPCILADGSNTLGRTPLEIMSSVLAVPVQVPEVETPRPEYFEADNS